MGDKYQRTRPSTSAEQKTKRSRKVTSSEASKYEMSKLRGQSLLSEGISEMVGILYRPKTPETRQTYEVILSFISESLGDQPRDILCGAADEVLQVLKNDKMREREKRQETENLLGKLEEERYSMLVNLCKKITDFGAPDQFYIQTDENIDETLGVNVQFEESDDDEDDMIGEIREDDEEDEGEGDDAAIDSSIHATNLEVSGGRSETKGKTTRIHPREIDAYWLQRKLSKTYDDPVVAQSKAAEVLNILKTGTDDRDIENQLVILLGTAQFDFIKLLRANRKMVLYCTLLASAQSQEEKSKLKEKMKNDPELERILKMLEAAYQEDSHHDEERQRKSEARIKDIELDVEGDEQLMKCKVLDLEDMAFVQGSHFMANKRCQLPDGSFRKQRKGCEVIHVPALKPKPFDANEVSLAFFYFSLCLPHVSIY